MVPETTESLSPGFFQNLSNDRDITILAARFGPFAPSPSVVMPVLSTLLVDGRLEQEAAFPSRVIVDDIAGALEQGAKAYVISRTPDQMNIMLEGTDWDVSLAVLLPPEQA